MALYLEREIMLLEDTKAYLYRWTHIPTGKWYVGSRTAVGCHPEDGYYCSSKEVKPLIIANPKEWKREILAVGQPNDILQLESSYLKKLDAKNDPQSFNRHNGDGKFTTTGSKWSDDRRVRTIASMTGVKKPEGFGDKVSKVHTGKTVSDKTKKLIGAASTGRSQSASAREKNRIANGGANNAGFKGYYTAPDGTVFDSSYKAADKYNVTRQTVVSWAKNNKNGWSFTPKKGKL